MVFGCLPAIIRNTLMQITKLLSVQVDYLIRLDELPEIEKTI